MAAPEEKLAEAVDSSPFFITSPERDIKTLHEPTTFSFLGSVAYVFFVEKE